MCLGYLGNSDVFVKLFTPSPDELLSRKVLTPCRGWLRRPEFPKDRRTVLKLTVHGWSTTLHRTCPFFPKRVAAKKRSSPRNEWCCHSGELQQQLNASKTRFAVTAWHTISSAVWDSPGAPLQHSKDLTVLGGSGHSPGEKKDYPSIGLACETPHKIFEECLQACDGTTEFLAPSRPGNWSQ